jgi:flagellar protein FliS
MYHSPGFAGSASRRYAAVHAGSRIESASAARPRQDFVRRTPAGDGCLCAGDGAGTTAPRRTTNISASISIVHALDSSLDFDQGGEIAVGLAQIYRETRRLLISRAPERHSLADARKALGIIAEIADAWKKGKTMSITPLMPVYPRCGCVRCEAKAAT